MKFLNHLILTGILSISFSSWAQFRPDIVGGVEANQGEFPFMVSLQSEYSSHYCGGSLIKEDWVLTAAHCMDSGYIDAVVFGVHELNNSPQKEVVKIKKVIMHPNFNSSTMDYDYALIQLEKPVNFEPVKLNRADIPVKDDEEQMSTTAGWGVLAENSYSVSNKLMKVDVPLVASPKCSKAYASYNEITDRMICAGYDQGKKDSCQGDSGGPLIMKKKNRNVLIGVVSWGKGCARPQAYGVYSKVSAAYQWIQEQTQ